MKQKASLKLIYKLNTKQLRKAKWNLTLPLEEAILNYPDVVVSIGDSQLLRFIDELNGIENRDQIIQDLQYKIKIEKRHKRSKDSTEKIKLLYKELYEAKFQKDYICVVMDNNNDYDRANHGFTVNGISYRRLLGTNGGIKMSTIVYVNAALYPELKRRIDNGRNMNVPLVPAKLEAYQALVCSGSIPLPQPNGVIVVDDCITHFTDNVILIDDGGDGEPELKTVNGYEVERNNSDGCGLMLPSYSRKVNECLNGDGEHTISGMNTRWAWTKGMVYTFDFIDFAEKVAGTYEVVDAWGDKRDVRNAEVILTVSMLKLWNCYDSWEDYYYNCQKNHYLFSTPKTTPDVLENVRDTNYQFLQGYKFTDEEIEELCAPTIREINDVLGMDYRKSLVFFAGSQLNETNIKYIESNHIKALMIDPKMINDPFVRRNLYSMIKKRIECAKKGSFRVHGNYAMISGDPYALAQSMFGLPVTGLLAAGEVYHRYWMDSGADKITCFRAPMTILNNVRKMKLNKSDAALYWFRYIETAMIYNAWDTSCDAMNGSDFDGDTNMCTDNEILLRNTPHLKTIMCMQHSAEKRIPSEEDIIKANKLAFNDDIGTITNHVTSMFEVQAGFQEESDEYKELEYRIMCGQLYQQASIDRAKGVISKPMPESWYSIRANDKEDAFHMSIAAPYKPYFMIYVYPNLRRKLRTYISNNNRDVRRKFRAQKIQDIKGLEASENKTSQMSEYYKYFRSNIGIGNNPCTVNRICWHFEEAFPGSSVVTETSDYFDYSILKSGVDYLKSDFDSIKNLYAQYKAEYNSYMRKVRTNGADNESEKQTEADFKEKFRMQAFQICNNEEELCDMILDLCYQKEGSKQFAWDIVGDQIIRNLLNRNGNLLSYPSLGGDEFEFCGKGYHMESIEFGDIEL